MNRVILCLLFSLTLWGASSQKVYFIYLQAEQEQPFYIKMNEKLYSSTGSGYLILSRLRDSSYSFNVGFPQNKWPEQNFTVPVKSKDHGYLLKYFGEKGWGLFDLQALTVQMSMVPATKTGNAVKPETKEVSAFTDILSKAADDPSLKEKPVAVTEPQAVKNEEIKTASKDSVITRPFDSIEQPVVKKEENKTEVKDPVSIKPAVIDLPVDKKEVIKTEIKEEPARKITGIQDDIPAEAYKRSHVIKKSESSTSEGFGLVFVDEYENGLKDTIRVLIPNPVPVVAGSKEKPKEENKFLDVLPDTAARNKCAAVADENDFFRLRKKMAGVGSDDDMVSEARKYFKIKCFTVAQIKNLGTLFLTDAGKYKFFDAAYSYVSDNGSFNTLQAELKDEYYINRFKAMLRN